MGDKGVKMPIVAVLCYVAKLREIHTHTLPADREPWLPKQRSALPQIRADILDIGKMLVAGQYGY